MSILVRFSPSAVTKETYDSTVQTLEAQGDWPPDGLDLHVCFGPAEAIKVSEVWDSQEQFTAFGERLRPVLDDAGIEAGEPEIIEVQNVIRR